MFTEVFKNNGLPRKEKGKYKKALNIIFGIEEDFYKGHIQTIYSKSNKIFYSSLFVFIPYVNFRSFYELP
ncbi:hypothetical protein LEP1GSC195_0298 [Leptospira wolbachii serovar Codice str. CDC]|uniref:Uncharacterized protein n=1 Tax=Leptospira wolbachii serovar Codice str. CDC TaxID=1218599 RepID=R8ZYN8_9LEPT|nr:hypothetical protein LEP1GSC195_0298 [Leptospira wolbachii serovar Codice str. CDC]